MTFQCLAALDGGWDVGDAARPKVSRTLRHRAAERELDGCSESAMLNRRQKTFRSKDRSSRLNRMTK